jgi:hypothetical protein
MGKELYFVKLEGNTYQNLVLRYKDKVYLNVSSPAPVTIF